LQPDCCAHGNGNRNVGANTAAAQTVGASERGALFVVPRKRDFKANVDLIPCPATQSFARLMLRHGGVHARFSLLPSTCIDFAYLCKNFQRYLGRCTIAAVSTPLSAQPKKTPRNRDRLLLASLAEC